MVGTTVFLDVDGAGHGWFVDTSPETDDEFRSAAGGDALVARPHGPAAGSIDLVSVVAHELGHVLGYEHESLVNTTLVLDDSLAAGERELPDGLHARFTPEATRQKRARTDVRIARSADVARDALLEAGVRIDAHARVGSGALLRAGSVIGKRAVVGERAIVGEGVVIEPGAIVPADSVVLAGSRVSAADPRSRARLGEAALDAQLRALFDPSAQTGGRGEREESGSSSIGKRLKRWLH